MDDPDHDPTVVAPESETSGTGDFATDDASVSSEPFVAEPRRMVWEPRSVDALIADTGVESLYPFQADLRAQAAARPDADILLEAPTGSGKTLAYAVVALDDLARTSPPIGPPAVVVIAPTRELAQQVDRVLLPFARGINRRVALLQGGVAFEPQLRNIDRGADIVVGTPGRLVDMLGRGQVVFDGVQTVIVDEADRLADMGFLDDVAVILDAVPPSARTLLVSATLSGDVDVLVDRLRSDPIVVRAGGDHEQAPEGLGLGTEDHPHRRVRMIRERLRADVGTLLDASGRSLVFVRTRYAADRWAQWIIDDGRPALALHGGLSMAGRREAVAEFRSGAVNVLVATDLAARGLDIAGVELVVHIERSDDERDYIHRSGRTGRAAAAGVVVNFLRTEQRRAAMAMEDRLGVVAVDAALDDVVSLLDDLGQKRPCWHPPLGRRTATRPAVQPRSVAAAL